MDTLITGGPVYTHIDDNKILTNHARGTWATRLGEHLQNHGHSITMVINSEYKHYRDYCIERASEMNAAVMTAAVINYICTDPYEGKMPTNLDEINLTLTRAPYVIDEMRKQNPNLTLIGCKLTSREQPEDTIVKAQQLMARARCHAVVANDKTNLKKKMLCFPDGAVLYYNNEFEALNEEIRQIIEDKHYHSVQNLKLAAYRAQCEPLMQKLLDRYRDSFHSTYAGEDKQFGCLAVRGNDGTMLVTPRHKHPHIRVQDCVMVRVNHSKLLVETDGVKATMNAPLLQQFFDVHPKYPGVVHLHQFLDTGVPEFPYAPPGTVRDSQRTILQPAFNIENHGFVAGVNEDGHIYNVYV